MSQPHSLFISDLHLSENQPQITTLFLNFLQNTAPQAQRLYILGDFFEAWIGDDDSSPFIERIKQALRQLNASTPIALMPGNRDFLIGERFCHDCGIQFLADPTLITRYQQKILLLHGDSLCTDDTAHMRYRRFTQSALTHKLALKLPLSLRQKVANFLRQRSRQHQFSMDNSYLDINHQAALQLCQQHQAQLFIHGHIHHAIIDKLSDDVQRLVLNAWTPTQGDAIQLNADGSFLRLEVS